MAALSLHQHPDPLLRQKAKRVKIIDHSIRELIAQMIDTMRQAQGVGLAATQVGVPLRVLVVELPDQEPLALINPQIVKRQGERTVEEGCLSVPGLRGEIKRSLSVTVKGLDPEGKEVRLKAQDLLAQALEHEIDHLNGVLYIDHLESQEKLHRIEPAEMHGEEETLPQ